MTAFASNPERTMGKPGHSLYVLLPAALLLAGFDPRVLLIRLRRFIGNARAAG
jgi:hypothetical protein